MSKAYQVTPVVRQVNKILCFFIRLGAMPTRMHVLTVRGRKTGKLYHTPVSVVVHEGHRFLVAPYGEVSWVKNARIQGEVMLEHGRKQETLHIKELPPAEAAPILKDYVLAEAITRPYFNASPDAPMDVFEADVANHPVFELIPAQMH